jgi:hypothetical protein
MAALFVAGCSFWIGGITGSGKLLTKTLSLGEFNKIDASGAFQVDVTQGATCSVVVTADDNVWDSLDVRNDGGTLYLGTKSGSYSNTHLSARIVLPHLSALTLSGATNGTIDGFNDAAGQMDLTVDGASKLEGELRQARVTLDIAGASTATLHGTAESLHITLSGASHSGLEDLPSDDVRADISGASNATVTARRKLDYDVSGASHLSYTGSPTVGQADVSGASSVTSTQ